MDDPYFEVKNEVESTLATLSSLAAQHARLARQTPSGASEELQWALSELKATLTAIEPDIEELQDSVAAIEEVGVARRLGISDKEVRSRREFVERAKGEIAAIRRQLPPTASLSPDRSRNRLSAASYPPSYHTSDEDGRGEESDSNVDFEQQHQTLLMEQQDRTLTDISGTVDLLRQQAQVMGREVLEQNAMLEDLDHRVDDTTSKLAKAQRKMDRFVREHSNSPSSWAVFILMSVLAVLLFIILFL
ncbi:hypothetical protein JCM10213_007521 [Rhodosporidiobolus nylandii]